GAARDPGRLPSLPEPVRGAAALLHGDPDRVRDTLGEPLDGPPRVDLCRAADRPHGRPSRLERRPHALPFVRREQPRPRGPLDERVRYGRLRLKSAPRPLESPRRLALRKARSLLARPGAEAELSARVCSTVCSIFGCRSLGKRLAATTIENTNI